VEGRLQTRKWQGQDGNDRYTTEIVANEMQMLGGRGGGQSGGPSAPPADEDFGQTSAGSKESKSEPKATSPEFDDDIPF